MNIYVVSECCPVGCGTDVVLLMPESEEPIFCYCDACGSSWGTPIDAQYVSGLEYIKGAFDYCTASVRFPTEEEIKEQGLYASVISVLETPDCQSKIVDQANEEIVKHLGASASQRSK